MSATARAGLLAAALAALAACPREPPPAPAPAAASARHYAVRGEVVALPEPGKQRDLTVRHESMPGFVDVTGAVVGMQSMVMPFPVPDQVSLEGIQAGDKITLRFAVDWQKPGIWVEGVSKLPPATPLDLGPGTGGK